MPWLPLVLLLCLCTQALVVLAGYDPARHFVFDVLAGRSVRLATLVLLGDVMLVLVLAIGLAAVTAWRLRWWGTSRWGCAARVHLSAVAASALGLLPLLWSLNLVGVPRFFADIPDQRDQARKIRTAVTGADRSVHEIVHRCDQLGADALGFAGFDQIGESDGPHVGYERIRGFKSSSDTWPLKPPPLFAGFSSSMACAKMTAGSASSFWMSR